MIPAHRTRPAVPEDASTVILLRPGPVCPEVFLLKRHEAIAFVGGAHVFPGGRQDPSDRDPNLFKALDSGFDVERQKASPGRTWSRDDARSAAITAIRELFEEAGVLLARRPGRSEVVCIPAERRASFDVYRRDLDAGTLSLSELLRAEHLEPAVEHLVYVGHWITPSTDSKRFDARFFLAAMPEGQVAGHDDRETVAGLWITARAALARHAQGALVLPPPTHRVLEELAGADTVVAALDAARRRTVWPILPKSRRESEGWTTVHLPWSARYLELEGEAATLPETAPDRAWAETIRLPEPGAAGVSHRETSREALEVLVFWFGPDLDRVQAVPEVAARWWRRDPSFDAEVARRLGPLRTEALCGALDGWSDTPEGALALILLLDQAGRNMFRNSPRAYESDAQALHWAEFAIAQGDDQRVSPMCRSFFYLPLMHAEDIVRQRASRLAFERLSYAHPEHLPALEASLHHLQIIERFGRFPHRNRDLQRSSKPGELEWLASHDGF